MESHFTSQLFPSQVNESHVLVKYISPNAQSNISEHRTQNHLKSDNVIQILKSPQKVQGLVPGTIVMKPVTGDVKPSTSQSFTLSSHQPSVITVVKINKPSITYTGQKQSPSPMMSMSKDDGSNHILKPLNSPQPLVPTTSNKQSAIHSKRITVNIPSSIAVCAESDPECHIEVIIRNVVCTFNTRCHLNLRQIAREGHNAIFKSSQNMVEMKIRSPRCTAFIFSSGKLSCTGSNSEDNSRKAARRYARFLQRLGFPVKFTNYKVVNVMATCAMPFTICLQDLTRGNPASASYEPEINPGVTYKFPDIRASLKIFTSGKITVTAPSAEKAEKAVQLIYPIVFRYKREYLTMKQDVNWDEDGETDFNMDGNDTDEDSEDDDCM